jgi:predicted SAM-dependent methyltransferase
MTEVLEHLNFHPVPTLKKVYNLLSENGALYLSTPDAYEWGKVNKYYQGYRGNANTKNGN